MKFEIQHTFRFTLMVISGFLIVGATATWHALGYLNPLAWVIEWLDVILAFLCILMAVRTKEISNRPLAYSLIIASATVIIIPLADVSRLPVFITPNPIHYLVFLIPILFLIILLFYNSKISNHRKLASFLFFVFVLGTMMYVTYLFYFFSMRFPTDESVVDLYSAHLFLNGLNPYNHVNIIGGFAYYDYPVYANTPLTTGGYVYYLTYPALSFITMIPAALFGVKGSLILYPFFAIPIFLTWFRGWSRKEWFNAIMVLVPFLSLSIYTSQVEFADLNIVWATLMMLSYYVLPKSKMSGILYGLSLSVKQFPAITLPFFVYFIFKEYGKRQAIFWISMSVLAFVIINGYFIAIDPHSFISSMVANELAPLIGVGFGLSQLSFLGFLPIPPIFFTISMVAVVLMFITLYVVYYRELKYALFVFPILIFLVNYRLFVQYILYWLILSLLPFMDLLHSKEQEDKDDRDKLEIPVYISPEEKAFRRKAVTVVLLLIVMSSFVAGFNSGALHSPGYFKVNSLSVEGYNSTGYVDQMKVNISFSGNDVTSTHVLFRFITPGPIGNLNMYLWSPVSNATLHSGETTTLSIVPVYSNDPIPQNMSFQMVAYYGNIMGSYSGSTQ